VHRRHGSARGAHQGETVVLERRDGPVGGSDESRDLGKVAHEPSKEIDGVDALLTQLATEGHRRISAPLPLVAWPAADAVDGAAEDRPAQSS
jgi:hypothetical protein